MRIVQTRRISQFFFFGLFVWFCVVATVGSKFWQIQGWPVNWLLQLDPLVAFGTILTTKTLYKGLIWALVSLVLTIILGRFFCGWVCPFGSIHQTVGFLAHRKATLKQKIQMNSYHHLQRCKYLVLIVFIVLACSPSAYASLLTGLLDPIPLVTRSFNLLLLPILDAPYGAIWAKQRFYEGAGLLFSVFFLAIILNLFVPRFYCRFICPLGALFGVVSRVTLWKIGKEQSKCSDCKACERYCEGGCNPSTKIRSSECVLCCNCLDPCKDQVMNYQIVMPADVEHAGPDISRRGFALSLVSGFTLAPVLGLGNQRESNYNHDLVRPPGSLEEGEFLRRCIKCGQCLRVCPTNVLQPAGFDYGIEPLWTPQLNNRIGSSGCQMNCTACGQICPTSAIRPLVLDEKLGRGEYVENGPVKIGTAFLNRGRCLPWAMDKPCIVCEENCPLSPKAIFTREVFVTIRGGSLSIKEIQGDLILVDGNILPESRLASGDYYCQIGSRRYRISGNSNNSISLVENVQASSFTELEVQVRLQRPYIDIERCTGCGICEHECPVSGQKAIRISAEGETRNPYRALLLKR